ncbi:SAV_2336 N-terminal domain-related protein [Streptomyces sp. NPDC005805]|uniref:SAV_2336 N-terminal domain-related protein n=1 Tax=Streptomyces sp. NPDC005805 TaxID=3157068 RepID=UPI0033E951C5
MTGAAGDRLGEALRVLGGAGRDLDPQELLDVLWLATRLPRSDTLPLAGPAPHPGPRPGPAPDDPPAPGTEAEDRPGAEAPGAGPDPGRGPELHAAARRPTAHRPPERRPGARRTTPPDGPPPDRRAMPLRAPEDKALRDELLIGRALRPLKQRRPSLRRHEVDETATAAALAETGLPDVVTRPARERWLHLVLLVDDGLSMLLWHRLVTELRTLMQRLGAFRSVRVHGLDTRGSVPVLRGQPFDPDASAMAPPVLTDPSGQTLILVLSDGMGAAWRGGAMHEVLHTWAASGPVSIVHTLPPALWEGSGIQADRWQATTRRRGGAGTSWTVTDRVLPPGIADFGGVPVPVLEPTARSLGDWAALIASPGTTRELPLLARPRRHTDAATVAGTGVQHFRDAASPQAYRLAAHLAAVSPVSVPVMRLVQAAVPWRAGTDHLAEVFLGGLLLPHPAPVPGPLPAQHRVFDFSEETKNALLDTVPSDELLRTSRSIGRRLEQLAGRSPDFPAWLAHPDGADGLPETFRAFTVVERRLLARLGVSFQPTAPVRDTEAEDGAPADDWSPLTPADPEHLGPYRLLGRRLGRRTVVYLGRDRDGNEAAVRAVRPDMPPSLNRLLTIEAEALRRMDGRYAPKLLGAQSLGDRNWTAAALVPSPEPGTPGPVRLSDLLPYTAIGPRPPLDVVTSITLGWHLAGALSLCHLQGLVPADLSPGSVVVLDRSVLLLGLSDCAVDGVYAGEGAPPTQASSVQALGELLRALGSKGNRATYYLRDGMELWQGDTWAPLRELVLKCVDHNPLRRPPAGEVAAVLARYVSIASAMAGPAVLGPVRTVPGGRTPGTPGPDTGDAQAAARRAPDEEPGREGPGRPLLVPALLPVPRRPAPRIGRRTTRFGAGRAEHADRLARIRTPRTTSRHVTVVGAHPLAGRSTTTVVLGAVLAAVRGEPVLALDGAPGRGELHGRTGRRRNPATLREAAGLPGDCSHEDFRRLTAPTPSGLEVLAHSTTHSVPSPAYTEEYRRIMATADRHYPLILTDWAPPRLDATAGTVLGLTDLLVMCCTAAPESVRALGERLAELRAGGYDELAAGALVVVARLGGTDRPLPDGTIATRLLDLRNKPLMVPFDTALATASATEPGLGRLRPATAEAFTELAARVAGTAPTGP